MVHIPYRGSAPALTDLMGGQIQLLMDAAVGLISPGKAGKVRLIGVASDSRSPALPDVPTFIEHGIKGFLRADIRRRNRCFHPHQAIRIVGRLLQEFDVIGHAVSLLRNAKVGQGCLTRWRAPAVGVARRG